MSNKELTLRELEYLECKTPLLSGGKATARIIMGIFASFAQAIVAPSTSYGKAERGLTRTIREISYTKYKKAVLRKVNGTPLQNDDKLLAKLNKKPFVLQNDTFDADEYTKKLYEEYMAAHRDK